MDSFPSINPTVRLISHRRGNPALPLGERLGPRFRGDDGVRGGDDRVRGGDDGKAGPRLREDAGLLRHWTGRRGAIPGVGADDEGNGAAEHPDAVARHAGESHRAGRIEATAPDGVRVIPFRGENHQACRYPGRNSLLEKVEDPLVKLATLEEPDVRRKEQGR